MANSLLQTAHQYTQTHSDREGIARTTVPGLVLIRSTRPTELEHAIVRPLLCLVLQGCKQVSMGNSDCSFGADETMLVTSNQPTVSRIISASPSKPYLSIALDLDPSIIAELNLASTQTPGSSALQHDASLELREAVRRLLQLLEQPHSLAVLQSALLREIHHWLLLGPQGAAVRNLGMPDSQVQRIARAVALLRENYKQRLTVERLAAAAGMGRSAFHQHFRAVTSLSPLQFQKQLRLIEARRLPASPLARSRSRWATRASRNSLESTAACSTCHPDKIDKRRTYVLSDVSQSALIGGNLAWGWDI